MENKIKQLESLIQNEYTNFAGMVILKDEEIVYEQYFNDHTQNDTFHIFSATKSVISILIGIAIDKGYIKSVDQKVLEFFPNYTLKRGEKTLQTVTLKHLLTMTAPFKFKYSPYTKVCSQTDWVNATLDLLGGKKPVGEFRYMATIGPDILSGILRQATGQTVLEFAQQYLFNPLNIKIDSNIYLYDADVHVSFIKNNDASGWVADENQTNTAGWGLTLSTRDMAKIGQLYLNEGVWNEKQIVSKEWVRESTREHSRWAKEDLPYGYLWWTKIANGYAAMGDSGNIIYVNSKDNLVISIAALFKPRAKLVVGLIEDIIEPIFNSNK